MRGRAMPRAPECWLTYFRFGLNVGEAECSGGTERSVCGVEPVAKRRADKLQTEAQREWRFDHPSVTTGSAVTRRTGGVRAAACHGASVGYGGEATFPMTRLGLCSKPR